MSLRRSAIGNGWKLTEKLDVFTVHLRVRRAQPFQNENRSCVEHQADEGAATRQDQEDDLVRLKNAGMSDLVGLSLLIHVERIEPQMTVTSSCALIP